jgi:hypothetical protein
VDLRKLKTIVRSIEPLSDAGVKAAPRELVQAYNEMLSRFHRRAARAGNSLLEGSPIEVHLAEELRFLTLALPSMRQRIEAFAQRGTMAWPWASPSPSP